VVHPPYKGPPLNHAIGASKEKYPLIDGYEAISEERKERIKRYIDKWIYLSNDLPKMGEMTHMERTLSMMKREEPDIVPCLIEYDIFATERSAYDARDLWDRPDLKIDACLKCWHDYQFDCTWQIPYMTDLTEPWFHPDMRPTHPWDPNCPKDMLVWRGPKDYAVFKPFATDIEDYIKLLERKVWKEYGLGSTATDFTAQAYALLEFQRRMGEEYNNPVPAMLGAGGPSNLHAPGVEVHRVIKWLKLYPDKMHRAFELASEFFNEAVYPSIVDLCEKGCKLFCFWMDMRTYGPKEVDEFGEYDFKWVNKCADVIHQYGGTLEWHVCGHNLKHTLTAIAEQTKVDAIQFDEPYMYEFTERTDFWEWAAKLFAKNDKGSLNGPTTQELAFLTSEQIRDLTKKFIEVTRSHTTVGIMPGCEIVGRTPEENVKACVSATRTYGKYK
jgi:uroporphyrinogen-III decarboxylase